MDRQEFFRSKGIQFGRWDYDKLVGRPWAGRLSGDAKVNNALSCAYDILAVSGQLPEVENLTAVFLSRQTLYIEVNEALEGKGDVLFYAFCLAWAAQSGRYVELIDKEEGRTLTRREYWFRS